MGVYTDLFVARPEDAKEIADDFEESKFKCHEAPGLLPDVLQALLSVLSDRPDSDAELIKEFVLLYTDVESDVCVYSFPKSLTEPLSGLKADQVPGKARLWAKTATCESLRIPVSFLKERLTLLTSVCKKAKSKKLSVLYGVCP